MAPFRLTRELLTSIPGFSTKTAEVIIAETGADITAGHLASWAGVSPGSNQSAGRIKSTKTRPGNPYLKGALGVSAMSAARSKNTSFSAKYQRIRARRGPMRALVAVEHALLITAWNMLTDGAFYRELGTDYYTMRTPAKAKPVRSVSSKRSATPSRSHRSPRPHNPQPAVDQWSPARVTEFLCQCVPAGHAVVGGGLPGPRSNSRAHKLPRAQFITCAHRSNASANTVVTGRFAVLAISATTSTAARGSQSSHVHCSLTSRAIHIGDGGSCNRKI